MNRKHLGVVVAGIAIDQATKWIAQTHLPQSHFLQLVHNFGAAYGIFQGKTAFLLGASAVALAALIGWKKHIITSRYSEWAWCFLMIGTLGNFLDRLFRGYVVDFIDIRIFPVFNVADVCIDIGIACFILELVLTYINRHGHTPV